MRSQKPAEVLERKGLRKTTARIALLGVLLRAKKPLTHEELLGRLQGIAGDRVTVYRTLQTFIEKGMTHRIEAGDRLWRFAVCDCGHSTHCHPHFTCRVCGTVECLNDVALPKQVCIRADYTVESQEVYMRGVCAQCAREVHVT